MKASDSKTTETDVAIRVDGLEKTYGSGEDAVTAVDEVSFEIEPGTIVGLLGPNGAGKTTTIKSLLGLILPDGGSVSICGVDVHEHPEQAHSHVGAMLEGDRNVYWRLTVRENLEYFAGLGGQWPGTVVDRHEELLDRLDLTEKADTPVNDLSKGMKQKVSLASTLARDVDIIFLDEPALGIDVETSQELYDELRRLAEEENITIVLTSHNLDSIEAVADRVMILNDGRIIADDNTEALVDLFRTQGYRIVINTPVPDPLRRRLGHEFDATIEADDERATIECFGADSQTLYGLIDLLDETGKELLEIESVEPDLEEVFLRMTGDEETPGEAMTDDAPGPNVSAEEVDADSGQATDENQQTVVSGTAGTTRSTAGGDQ